MAKKDYSTIRIEGVDEAIQTLKEYPTKINSVIKTSMRKAIAPVIKDIKAGTPHSSFRKLVKSKFIRDTAITIKFGFFGNKSGGGRTDVPAWFKAYWSNYGTLGGRFKPHTFDYPIKARSKNVRGGIRPKLFLEQAVQGKEQQIYNDFTKNLIEGADKLDKK